MTYEFIRNAISCMLCNEGLTVRAIVLVLTLTLCVLQICMAQVDPRWKPNDSDRPVPPVIEPGTASTQDSPGRPPADAVVLFGGKDLSSVGGRTGAAGEVESRGWIHGSGAP